MSMTLDRIEHLTLTTGHSHTCTRVDTDQGVMRMVVPLVRSGGGRVSFPSLPLDLHLYIWPRTPGEVVFQISREPGKSMMPLAVGVACWSEEKSRHTWDDALIPAYRGLEKVLRSTSLWREPPRDPPSDPWLGVYITPFIAMLPKQENLVVFGQIEQTIVWAAQGLDKLPHAPWRLKHSPSVTGGADIIRH